MEEGRQRHWTVLREDGLDDFVFGGYEARYRRVGLKSFEIGQVGLDTNTAAGNKLQFGIVSFDYPGMELKLMTEALE